MKSQAIDLDELQGEPEFIAARKAKTAAAIVKGPVIIEDVSLCFSALNGLPGPYIKSFLEKLGRQGLYNLVRHENDKSARALCIYALCLGTRHDPSLFVGKCEGIIVEPRGDSSFGWDPIFQPQGHS